MGLLFSCRNDDDVTPEAIPPRLLSEVAAEDEADILAFLSTHTFNYEEFREASPNSEIKIKFDTIAGENADKTAILDINSENIPGMELISETISVASSDFGRSDEEVIDHTLYILIARQGAVTDSMPTIGDNAIVRYEGQLLNGTFFDASSAQPISFNLSGVVRGFGNGVEYFQKGMGPFENGDGTISYEGYGIGAIFIPSGLGYFASPSGSIPSYTPLIFKIDLFDYEPDTDFDGDGIPSIQEDINNDGNLNNDNTDDETEPFNVFLANYNDADDDGDGIPTRDEILIDGEIQKDANGKVIFPDTDGDGIPDHLDNE
jgi:FKBP-type peptidyl-prolyl cis-trans isomerase